MMLDFNFTWNYWHKLIHEYFEEIYNLRAKEEDYEELRDVSPECIEDYLYRELKQQYEKVKIESDLCWQIEITLQDKIMIVISGVTGKCNLSEAELVFYICDSNHACGEYEHIKDIRAIFQVCAKIKDNLIIDLYILNQMRLENQKKIRLYTMAKSLIEAYSKKLLEPLGYKWQLLNLKTSFILKIQKENGAKVEIEIKDDNYVKAPDLIKESINSLEMIDKFLS